MVRKEVTRLVTDLSCHEFEGTPEELPKYFCETYGTLLFEGESFRIHVDNWYNETTFELWAWRLETDEEMAEREKKEAAAKRKRREAADKRKAKADDKKAKQPETDRAEYERLRKIFEKEDK